MIVNQKELAQCLGISTRQVRNLRQDGMFQQAAGTRGYSIEKCVQEYIDFKINAELGRSASISKEKIQAEHEEVKRQISVLKLRKLRRELHEAADVEAFLSDMLIQFKNRLLSLPTKMAMEIAGETDVNQIIDTLTKDIYEALDELSEYDPDDIDGQEAGTYDEMYEDEDDEDEDDEI
ncbi:DNA-packaging protein [Hungatella sp. L12]|uniref:DNA-packaging protein n=1 Tax=Hungatella hominis TaxID=2763050 RepID=A0ABR7HGT0_9FIRM|nr:DNA-packaging protein [Hungatella hominis]MBC5712408.1 DNA-packaging protein [Hungatella hominis]